MTLITPQVAHGLAIARAAECMLRTLGGVEVAVRFAAPTSTTAEFGIASSSVVDITVSPVVVRNSDGAAGTKLELIFSAATVDRAAQLDDYSSAADWFEHALGIFFDDTLHPITSIAMGSFAGQPYLYRVTTG